MEEDNILLANFLGAMAAPYELPQFCKLTLAGNFKDEFHADQLRFHKDWRWLMEVVGKIEKLSYIKGRYYYLHKEAASVQIRVDRMVHQPFSKWGTSGNTDVQLAIYRACVEFVKWYNLNNKK